MGEGFGRNIQKVFGYGGLFNGMAEKPLHSVTLSDDKEKVTFSFEDGSVATFGVEGDCCSHSWIEHLTVPDDIKGQALVEVQDECMERVDNEDEYEVVQSYQTKFRTDKGETVTLEYRNSSNGYYGGYLVRLDSSGDIEKW